MSGDTLPPAGVPGAVPRQALSLPHNIHPDQMVAGEPTGNRWKRFQPLKRLQRIFRRKGKTKDEDGFPEAPKSFSASQLLPGQRARPSRQDSPPLQSRLSMSHDSIFQSDGPPPAQGELGSALSIPSIPGAGSQLTAELRGVLLKRRGDDSDDDPGLPHSPATPPNAARLQQELKVGVTQGHADHPARGVTWDLMAAWHVWWPWTRCSTFG
ncbi:uncharacterized protein LOC119107189 [Pollicipes pollicipes]|uniref:uncharacterized protein LOC119107189 n=1 Tax=Pollicipes pollicipes TaxID=41117 RepID=UPI001884F3EA|nr:uncharacterized protein LOC119107189 [Pollicipes pollicipes]